MSPKAPVEGKVWSSTIGSGIGVTLSTLVLWMLGVTIWDVPIDAESAAGAILAVPDPIAAPISLFVTIGAAFLAGFLTKHTPRPEVTEALDKLKDEEDEDLPDDHVDLDDGLGLDTDTAPDVDEQDPEAPVVDVPASPDVIRQG